MGAGGEVLRRAPELMAERAVAVVLFGPQGQGGFNQAGLAGADRARASAPGLEVFWCEPPADRAEFLRGLCRRGFALVIAHGGQGDAPVAQVAPEFPRCRFVVTQGSRPSANVAIYEALQEQSAYLAGVLAASMTATGTVAHMSGERVRPGLKGRAAFADGVRRTRPEVRLLTCFCGDQHDPELAYRVVSRQADAGADVLFAMIDGGRPGAIRACRERAIGQIGNVFDWTSREPDVFIASAIADSGACIELAVRDDAAGTLHCGTTLQFGLEVPSIVRLALAARVPPPARQAITQAGLLLAGGAIAPAGEFDGEEMVFQDRW
jgi:basic membrane protein A